MSSTRDLRLLRYWARLPLLHKVLTVVALPTFALLVTMMSVVLADQQDNSANEWVKHTLIVRAQIDRTPASRY